MTGIEVALAAITLALLARAVLSALEKKKSAAKMRSMTGWFIGPEIKGRNYSVGMPERPTTQGEGWSIDFPTSAQSHVDYVQWFSAPSLVGAKQLVIRYAVTGGDFKPFEYPDRQATVGVQFQRKGDDWSGNGKYQSYRWYSRKLPALKAGEFTLSVPLVMSAWNDVYGKSDNQAAFDAALADMSNFAIVFGHATGGAGHGVFATKPSRFTLISLDVVRSQ